MSLGPASVSLSAGAYLTRDRVSDALLSPVQFALGVTLPGFEMSSVTYLLTLHRSFVL